LFLPPLRYYSRKLEKQPLRSTPIALSDDIGAAKTTHGNWASFIMENLKWTRCAAPIARAS
jgi:hypothetical protein